MAVGRYKSNKVD